MTAAPAPSHRASVVAAPAAATDRPTPADPTPPASDRAAEVATTATERRVTAALCVVAGGVHVLVVPQHLAQWAPGGVLLAVAGLAQLGLAVALWRGPAPRVVPLAVVATIALVSLYVASRTIGLPFLTDGSVSVFGRHHGTQVPGGRGNGMPIVPGSGVASEPVGALDLVCVVAELAALALLVGMLAPNRRRSVVNLLLAAGVCGWLVWTAARFA